jgi:hypothetical protein
VPAAEVGPFAAAPAARRRGFGRVVKETESRVLPSKAAHFLLPGLVPAVDREVVQNGTLWRLAPRSRDTESDPVMCWWVLRQFRREGTLGGAREAVAAYMLERPTAWTRRLPRSGAIIGF